MEDNVQCKMGEVMAWVIWGISVSLGGKGKDTEFDCSVLQILSRWHGQYLVSLIASLCFQIGSMQQADLQISL